MGKRKKQIRKEELEKADPQLLPPTQNMEENLARGESSMVPDPDDVPDGATSTQNGQIISRADKEQAEAEGYLESTQQPKQKNR